MRISACYIVRNEAANLERSLASLEGAVDEIIVVDTGSSDDTVKTAEAHGARVFHFPWRDDFSAARNVSLEKATGDWILVVDADEYFPESMGEEIRLAVERYGSQADMLLFMHRDVDEESGKKLLESYVPRILRRVADLAYEGAIHEEPRHGGRAITRIAAVPSDELLMLHTGYSASLLRTKGERNLALLRKELESGHPRNSIYMYLAETYDGLGEEEEALKYAWLDVNGGKKNYVFASRSYRILLSILSKRPKAYPERRRAAYLAARDFPKLPEFHAEYAECLGLDSDYQGAIREGKMARFLAKFGVGTGSEPSMFGRAAEGMLADRLILWMRLLHNGMDEALLQKTAATGDWRELYRESEQAVWWQGERLFALLFLMRKDEAATDALEVAEALLPPEMASVWNAYNRMTPGDEGVERAFLRLIGDVARLVGIQNSSSLATFACAFSEEGKTAAARIFMEEEAWDLALAVLQELPENGGGEVSLMKGICLYHTGDWVEAKRFLLRAQDISFPAEASSYLRWIEEAAGDA